eukprot:s267_g18.t1
MTVETIKKHPPEHQAILKVALNGTFFTADHAQHQNPQASSKCKFCQQEDSQVHRHWDCPHFADCRASLSEQQVQLIKSLPPIVSNHGWVPEPPSLREFQAKCLQLPDSSNHFSFPPECRAHYHVFTDGSCLCPTSPYAKLASWGVALGTPDNDQFWPLSCGVLQGFQQSTTRAEVLAAISACEFSITSGSAITMWVDNDLLFRRLRRFQKGSVRIVRNQKDADLWKRLQSLVQRLGHCLEYVGKVVSHQNMDEMPDAGSSWIVAGNQAADAIAAMAYAEQPELMETWKRLRSDIADVHMMRNALHSVLIAVGVKAIMANAATATQVDVTPPEIQVAAFVPRAINFEDISKRFALPNAREIIAWFETLFDPSENAPTIMVSWFQLAILFEHQESCALRFWTMCVAGRFRLQMIETADRLLTDVQPTFNREAGALQQRLAMKGAHERSPLEEERALKEALRSAWENEALERTQTEEKLHRADVFWQRLQEQLQSLTSLAHRCRHDLVASGLPLLPPLSWDATGTAGSLKALVDFFEAMAKLRGMHEANAPRVPSLSASPARSQPWR